MRSSVNRWALYVVAGAAAALGLGGAPPESAPEETSESVTPAPVLPWQPLSEPPLSHAQIETIVDRMPTRERIPALEALAGSTWEDPVARGLAQFAVGWHQLKKRETTKAINTLSSPLIEDTELRPIAGLAVAKALEKTQPSRAIEELDAIIRMGRFAGRAEAVLLYARLLRERGETDRAFDWVSELAETGQAAEKAEALELLAELATELGRTDEAVAALQTLYFEMPTQKRSQAAGKRLRVLEKKLSAPIPGGGVARDLRRADQLMAAERYSDAYTAYRDIAKVFAATADGQRLRLKQGVALYRRRRFTEAKRLLDGVSAPSWRAEAAFYLAEIERRRRRRDSFRKQATLLIDTYPKSPWAESALFSLYRDTYDREEFALANGYLEQMLEQFPRGKHFLKGQWAFLWEKYKLGEFLVVATEAEKTAREYPGEFDISRFLYFGARSYEKAGQQANAEALYHQVLLGYQNTYYGRRAYERLAATTGAEPLHELERARRGIDLGEAFAVRRTKRQLRIGQLVSVGRHDLALDEAENALTGEPDDPAFLAIAAWLHADQKRTLSAIIAIRKAFPFHISATGDLIPQPIWKLFCPMPYKDTVHKYARERGLDPFLVAGLIRQESTFNPKVRSRAGARGLMQIMPATGRQLARQEKRSYRLEELYDPDVNIRYGTRYLKGLLKRFDGRVDYALAGYNAGPHRVIRWTGRDMEIDPEIFIEDIPFEETRNYVKLVLRNEMLYRRLYGGSTPSSTAPVAE